VAARVRAYFVRAVSIVAEIDGHVAGSNFLWETAPVVG
jgi:hypothetical protein